MNDKQDGTTKTSSTKDKKEKLKILWEEFLADYPTVASCFEKLMTDEDEEVCCKYCNSKNLSRERGDREGHCNDCKKKSWFLSDTFFRGIRRPIAYYGAIWLIERGAEFNSHDLYELTGVSYKTARKVFLKLSFIALKKMEDEECLDADSALFDMAFIRRSRLTQANEHPKTEQQDMEEKDQAERERSASDTEEFANANAEQSNKYNDESSSHSRDKGHSTSTQKTDLKYADPSSTLEGPQKVIYDTLSDQPMHFNEICEKSKIITATLVSLLITMELKGIIEHRSGDFYVRALQSSLQQDTKVPAPLLSACPSANLSITLFEDDPSDSHGAKENLIDKRTESIFRALNFILETFFGISRKYLQFYLAAYWYRLDREKWRSGTLLKTCKKFRKIEDEEINGYVTPLRVKLMACA